ncbi:MAG: hypothetical protein GY711_01260 [bacterium]|nr:hypothetical protein [bacterium]
MRAPSELVFALALCAAPGLQEPTAKLELESLDGTTRQVAGADFSTTDPRTEGAVFVRYVHAGPAPARDWPERETVTVGFRGGDHVAGRIVGGDGDDLTVECVGKSVLKLSIDDLSRLVYETRIPRDGETQPVPAQEGDRLYRVGGRGLDRVDGLVSAFTKEGVVFEGRVGERTYAWDTLAALFIEDLEVGTDAPGEDATGVPVVASLSDGGRLSGQLVRLDGVGCTINCSANSALTLPARALAEVAVDDGSYRFLSQLPIADTGPLSPWGDGDELGLQYPPKLDRTFNDRPLRAGGRAWARGLGVHAPSRLTWRLDGAWKELRLGAAIDDQVLEQGNHKGSVVFRVHVDGEVRYESPIVRGGGELPRIPVIALVGAKELILEVDPHEDHVMDRADWLRPLLIRAQ